MVLFLRSLLFSRLKHELSRIASFNSKALKGLNAYVLQYSIAKPLVDRPRILQPPVRPCRELMRVAEPMNMI